MAKVTNSATSAMPIAASTLRLPSVAAVFQVAEMAMFKSLPRDRLPCCFLQRGDELLILLRRADGHADTVGNTPRRQ
jgi:hypothetical protein